MADEIRQLAFKEFTDTEIEAGTRWDALTTNGTTNYVIKSIEATNGSSGDNAITASATIGLTTDFNNGKYVSLGECAKSNRVGLSGSSIMAANSTLSIRPQAKSISYRDHAFHLSRRNSTNNMNQWQIHADPYINNIEDGSVSNTYINKSGVTHSSVNLPLLAYPENYCIHHTNANGVNLAIYFTNNTSNTTGFNVINADDGTNYGYYQSSYGQPFFDGERYIYFMRSSTYDHQICFYDLDVSNLNASATQGGASGQNFFHGAWVYAGNQNLPNNNSYDNRRCAFYYDRLMDRKFIIYNAESSQETVLYEIPTTTPTNDYNNTGPKWVTIRRGGNSNFTDPFGNNTGGSWSIGQWLNSYTGHQNAHMKLTYDVGKARYLLFMQGSNGNDTAVFTFTRAEYDATASEGVLDQSQGNNYGLVMVAKASASDIGISDTIFYNYSGGNGTIRNSYITSYVGGMTYQSGFNAFYEGLTLYQRNSANSDQLWAINLTTATASKVDTGMTDAQANVNTNGSFWMGWAVPSSGTISARTYNNPVKLTVRISGILSDQ